jgi:peptidoglycan/xylan/chitin deacetylase (PgdA/CDA1 family)
MRGLLTFLLLAACHEDGWLHYAWDDQQVLCSQSVDDITQDLDWGDVEDQIDYSADTRSVALVHAHVPGETITADGLRRLLDLAAQKQLAFVTYADFAETGAQPRAGIALAFDDQAVEAWHAQLPLLADYGAHVTFFVTRYARWTEEQRRLLAELHAAGHDVQAHSVDHLNAKDYVNEKGMAAYLDDEVLPSISILQADGFEISAFAFPFGASNDELDDAVLAYVPRVRVSPGSCPY